MSFFRSMCRYLILFGFFLLGFVSVLVLMFKNNTDNNIDNFLQNMYIIDDRFSCAVINNMFRDVKQLADYIEVVFFSDHFDCGSNYTPIFVILDLIKMYNNNSTLDYSKQKEYSMIHGDLIYTSKQFDGEYTFKYRLLNYDIHIFEIKVVLPNFLAGEAIYLNDYNLDSMIQKPHIPNGEPKDILDAMKKEVGTSYTPDTN